METKVDLVMSICYLRACQHWKVVSIISALQNLPSLTPKVEFL